MIVLKEVAGRVNKILGKLPGFMYKPFEKMLHLKQLNEILENTKDSDADGFIDYCIDYINLQSSFSGFDALSALKSRDESQSVMVVSNHPYGGPEALVTLKYFRQVCPSMMLLTQSFLKFIKPLESCCVFNKKDVSTLYDAVKKNSDLLIYPAGRCSRKLSFKEYFDYDWRKGFVKIARKNNMKIIVLNTDGHLSRRFFRTALITKIFRLKTTVETSLLPDEMFKMSGKTVNIRVSEPIDASLLTTDVPDEEWAARLREFCYEMGKGGSLCFDRTKQATLPQE